MRDKICVFSMPCEMGGRVEVWLEEGYTIADLREAMVKTLAIIEATCNIYRPLTKSERMKLFSPDTK